MGRYYYSSKQEADSLLKIQTWWLKKNGYLDKGCWKSGGIRWYNSWTGQESNIIIIVSLLEAKQYIELDYKVTDRDTNEETKYNYKLPLTSTNCFFGGKRWWFLCNLWANGKYCGRRVAVLYKGGNYFACRHCYNLSYSSRNENRRYKDYALFYVLTNRKKADELRQKIRRKTYAGKLTRKQRALNKLYENEFPYDMDIYQKKLLSPVKNAITNTTTR